MRSRSRSAPRISLQPRPDGPQHDLIVSNARGVQGMTNQSMNRALSSAGGETVDAGAGIDGLSQFISFAIGGEQYGVDIMAVREIKGWSQITQLPAQPDYMRGVLNLRGAMVPIIDLRCRFGQGMTEATPLHVVIVTQISGRPIGLLAGRVPGMVAL